MFDVTIVVRELTIIFRSQKMNSRLVGLCQTIVSVDELYVDYVFFLEVIHTSIISNLRFIHVKSAK